MKKAKTVLATAQSVSRLKGFVQALVRSGVKSSEDWRNWRQVPANEIFMEESFEYVREAGMPSVTNLIKPFFHPTLPLIGLNYTPVAHNTLHQFASGWTAAMRLCRGIVFTRRGRLVAFPFPKFFNYGEHAETSSLPENVAFSATLKHDGHLGIIFEYGGTLVATTRGSFLSSSGAIANEMLAANPALLANWRQSRLVSKDVTLLCEIIHPETKVIVDYGDRVEFILIGAFNRVTFEDYDYEELAKFASDLGVAVTERLTGKSLADLALMVKETEYLNLEGIVVRFAGGLRVKLKYAGYVGKMIEDKVDYRYMMLRCIDGSHQKRFGDLPAELQMLGQKLVDEMSAVRHVQGDKKAKWAYLYNLVPEEERTAYHKGICRKFYAWLLEQDEKIETAA